MTDCLVLKTNCIRQPKRKLPSSSYNLSALATPSVKESLQMHFKIMCSKRLCALNASRSEVIPSGS